MHLFLPKPPLIILLLIFLSLPSPAAAAGMSYDKPKPATRPELVVTVLFAESLKLPSSLILPRHRLRPYVALSTATDPTGEPLRRHRTRVDEKDPFNPSWNDTILLPVDPSFLVPRWRRRSGSWEEEEDDSAAVHIRVLSKGLLGGTTELGWCRILPGDVIDGLRLPGMARRLSYVLRTGRHGGRSHGVIHLNVRMEGVGVDSIALPPKRPMDKGWEQVAVGIPLAAVAVKCWGPVEEVVSERRRGG